MKLYIYSDGLTDTYSYRVLDNPAFIPALTRVLDFKRRLAVSCIQYRLQFLQADEMVAYTWLFGDVIKDGEANNFVSWFDERFGTWLDPQRPHRIAEYLGYYI